jgi:protein-S-isoprenylcysteine O-methyltransferase Ste14
MLFALPFVLAGLALNFAFPSAFEVGGPPPAIQVVSIVVLTVGFTIWIWSVVLILTRIPRGELITIGPYALMKHPLYTGVALFVLPSIGLLANTWVGALVGAGLYLGSRRFAPEEEAELSRTFGPEWDDYCREVKAPWL